MAYHVLRRKYGSGGAEGHADHAAEDIDALITDKRLEKESLEALRASGLRVDAV